MLRKIPEGERPRERLLLRGAEALSLTELLAICLGSGRKGQSVLSLAETLLSHFGDLTSLTRASVEALTEVKGIGKAKATQLKAAFALGVRVQRIGGEGKCLVASPQDAYRLIAPEIQKEKREVLALLMRDAKKHVFHHEIIAMGTLSEVMVHPREVFHQALHHRAFSLIIVHNHPSGDPTPSQADIDLTQLLMTAGNLLGIPLDDHIIVGAHSAVSLWEKGIIKRAKY
ncbi:MAG: DNA repair protein RadC [Simkaniaceae bacterium]|jgi:DNA repair protein RadC